MAGLRYIRPGDCVDCKLDCEVNFDIRRRTVRIKCTRCIFPPPVKNWSPESDADWGWDEYICERTAIGNVVQFKRWGWVVACGKVICPSCLIALVREKPPTQQDYAKWAKTVPKPKRAKTKPKTKVPVPVPIGRGLELND